MTDAEVWNSLVAAERRATQLRAEFHRLPDRSEILAASLTARAGLLEQSVAMSYLRSFPSEVPQYVPQIFAFALGGRWEGRAAELLAAGPRAQVVPQLARCVTAHLPMSDPEDYVQLTGLLARLEAGDALELALAHTLRSDDPDIRAVGDMVRETYGDLLPRR